MKYLIDLHLHSNVVGSDGTMSPVELVEYIYKYAAELGVDGCDITIALTDHNVTTGLDVAKRKAGEYSMNFIPGCEVMLYYPDYDIQIEILVYGRLAQLLSVPFREIIAKSREALQRKIKIQIERWYHYGFKIVGQTVDLPESLYEELNSMNLINDYDFFVRYIKPRMDKVIGKVFHRDEATRIFYEQIRNKEGQLYVESSRCGFPSPKLFLSAMRESGVITSLAHPGEYKISRDNLFAMIESLKEFGLAGVEVYSRKNSEELIKCLYDLCERDNLLMTGGSDFHGSRETCKIGMYASEKYIPYNVVFSLDVGI